MKSAALPPVFIINLPGAADRRVSILSQCEKLGLPATLVEAVDGRVLTEAQRAAWYDKGRAVDYGRPLSPSEIGCSLSHLKIYKRMVDENLPCALVLEDDAQLGENVPGILREVAQGTAPDAPVVFLFTYVRHYSRFVTGKLSGGVKIVTPYKKRYFTAAHGYFITRAAASLLHGNLFPVWLAADAWPVFRDSLGLQIKALAPYCIGLNGHAAPALSSIESGRTRPPRKQRVHDILCEWIWRRFIHRLFVLPLVAGKQKCTW